MQQEIPLEVSAKLVTDIGSLPALAGIQKNVHGLSQPKASSSTGDTPGVFDSSSIQYYSTEPAAPGLLISRKICQPTSSISDLEASRSLARELIQKHAVVLMGTVNPEELSSRWIQTDTKAQLIECCCFEGRVDASGGAFMIKMIARVMGGFEYSAIYWESVDTFSRDTFQTIQGSLMISGQFIADERELAAYKAANGEAPNSVDELLAIPIAQTAVAVPTAALDNSMPAQSIPRTTQPPTQVQFIKTTPILYYPGRVYLKPQPAHLNWHADNTISIVSNDQLVMQCPVTDISKFSYTTTQSYLKLRTGQKLLINITTAEDLAQMRAGHVAGAASGLIKGPIGLGVGAAGMASDINVYSREGSNDSQWWVDNLNKFGVKSSRYTMFGSIGFGIKWLLIFLGGLFALVVLIAIIGIVAQ